MTNIEYPTYFTLLLYDSMCFRNKELWITYKETNTQDKSTVKWMHYVVI